MDQHVEHLESWIQRSISLGSFFVCTIICFYLLIVSYKQKKLHNNIWALLSVGSCCIHTLIDIIFTIQCLCVYINHLYALPYLTFKIFFTFYQISRLQHLSMQKRSIWLYRFLYSNGILIMVLLYFLKITTNSTSIVRNKFGMCMLMRKEETIFYYIIIPFLWYYIWDILVLCMYTQAIHNLKIKHLQTCTNQHQKNNLKKIKTFLGKVLFLSIGNQTISFLLLLALVINRNKYNENKFQRRKLFGMGLDMVCTCIVLLLITEICICKLKSNAHKRNNLQINTVSFRGAKERSVVPMQIHQHNMESSLNTQNAMNKPQLKLSVTNASSTII
eukprot:378156_1